MKRISLFDGADLSILCPSFYVLKWARGCPNECSYCYLRRTFRRLETGKSPVFYPLREVLHDVDRWLAAPVAEGEPTVLNAGELADSLMPGAALPMGAIVRRFEHKGTNVHGKTLLLLSKGAEPAMVEAIQHEAGGLPPARVVLSITLNAPGFVSVYEEKTPPIEERLALLRWAKSEGWRVRVRIDPIAPWFDYSWLCGQVRALAPERVTLGSFRFYDQDKGWFRPDAGEHVEKVWAALGQRDTDKRRRLARRLDAFVDVAALLPGVQVGLCKETMDVAAGFWSLSGRGPVGCNCT